jgi:carboxylesterase type B
MSVCLCTGHQPQGLRTLVIIHGTDYGWSSANAYNGSVLASYGNIIVVTINYRLGVFGVCTRARACM